MPPTLPSAPQLPRRIPAEGVWIASDYIGGPRSFDLDTSTPTYLIERIPGTSPGDKVEVNLLYYSQKNDVVDGYASSRTGLAKQVTYYRTPHGGLQHLVNAQRASQPAALMTEDGSVWKIVHFQFPAGKPAKATLSQVTLHPSDQQVNALIMGVGSDMELREVAANVSTHQLQLAAPFSHFARAEIQRRTTSPQTGRDLVTDLRERPHLDAFLADSISKSLPVAVLFLDIDHFKAVNDSKGHQEGDQALRAVAAQLTAFAFPGQVFRYGGEEIVAVLPNADSSRALAVAEHIRQVVEQLPIPLPGGAPYNVTVSIGVALATAAEPAERVLKRADVAVYKAKNSGRNRVALVEA